jgi:carbon-monoxide dehydrogenase large subunit
MMSILGNYVVRKEDPKLLTTGGMYVADLELGDAYVVDFVTSTMAFAEITMIDVEAARGLEGVIAVYTAADLPLVAPSPMITDRPSMVQPYLADGMVRYVGEPVAMIVAVSAQVAEDAAELVFIDYTPREAVIDPREAIEDRNLLFTEEGTNIVSTLGSVPSDDLFKGAEVIVEADLENQRLAPVPLEVRALAARPSDDGRLEVFSSTQTPHSVRDEVAKAIGLPEDNVHVITPDVGGGFGPKSSQYVEETLVAWAAHALGHAVRWTESRSKNLTGLGHGRAQVQHLRIGATKDGKIIAYSLDVIQDVGAYPMVGTFLPILTMRMASGTYDIPKIGFRSRTVVTNTTPIVSYRGAGRPEATEAIEYAIDRLAAALEMDPAEVRRRNLIANDRFPVTTVSGSTYDVGDYATVLERALDHVGYGELRREQAERRQRGDRMQIGLGISVYVEVTNPFPSKEYGAVSLLSDGSFLVRSGTSPQGQGHNTSWSMLVAELFGVGIADVTVVTGDTDIVPRGVGTFGSRSLQLGGVAVHLAATNVLAKAKQLAAEMLEANIDDLVVDDQGGGLHVAGTPSQLVNWSELATEASNREIELTDEVDFAADSPTYPFGAHVAVVEVDIETGKVRLTRIVAVDDAGRIVAPLLAEGQVHGGLAQGISQALFEEVAYDRDGNPLTATLADYAVPSAAELPSFEVLHHETPTHVNPLGVKGIGESGTIGSTPAVHNAVIDALRYLGVDHVAMPTTPRRVWEAIQHAKQA